MRWRLSLPTLGLLLFALEAWESDGEWRICPSPSQYFW